MRVDRSRTLVRTPPCVSEGPPTIGPSEHRERRGSPRNARWRPLAVALALSAVMGPSSSLGAQEDRPFLHEEHAGLFPLCTGCHEGVPEGETGGFFPGADLCNQCHNAEERDLEPVEWSAPPVRSELQFEHPVHRTRMAEQDSTLECAGCHSEPGMGRMEAVFRVQRETCTDCHEHETPDHYVVGACATCHLPLAETGWDTERIADMETPSDHEPADPFLMDVHGPGSTDDLGRCATCHTQDRCASCHVNAGVVAEIEDLPPAPADMILPEVEARYPTPATHEAGRFLENHETVENGAECATCHTRDDCASCHFDTGGSGFSGTVVGMQVQAPGVGIESEAPASHASSFFLTDHAVFASSDEGVCATCHTTPFCNDCHDEARAPAFHEANFVQRHATDSYGRNMECANCHSTEVFCRACHVESGLGSAGGRLAVGYHDAEPVWLLRHGQAARQYLETCQTCHAQRECLQCHSQTGAFQVSPHGPDFDARRAQERNPAVCLACHLTDPLEPGR